MIIPQDNHPLFVYMAALTASVTNITFLNAICQQNL